jgi:hypothetical protein
MAEKAAKTCSTDENTEFDSAQWVSLQGGSG